MSVQIALEALKRQDFATARALMARESPLHFTLMHFLVKGLSEASLQDWPASLQTFIAGTERFPEHPLMWLNRGIAEENLGKLDDAIRSQERCITLDPDQMSACGNLSNLYRKQRRFAEAEAMARRALASPTEKGLALNCLGLALSKLGKFGEAIEAYQEALRISPQNAEIRVNLANAFIDTLQFDKAWPNYAAARASGDHPILQHDESLARMLAGDYETGWRLFESRFSLARPMTRLLPFFPRWRGEDLAGKKLAIIAEQGLGDVIQFCRYHKFLPPDVELIWAVPQGLVRLLSGRVRGLVFFEQDPALPACDYYIPVISLPLALNKITPQQAGSEPYLAAPAAPLLPKGKYKKKIGLVWAGSPGNERDHERSFALEKCAPLFKNVKASFYAPFIGEALKKIGNLPVIALDNLITDFADTAALLKQLDCLITVDTAVAHLAGALGVPTFLLLPYCPDWRWGVSGETTPWYASMTIVRQKTYGDWDGVIAKLPGLLKSRL